MKSPIRWVPTLYFTQGLPFYTVALVAALMLKDLGIANDRIARWTGVLGLAWVFKPLWSPLLERAADKKPLVVAFQAVGACAMTAVALALQAPAWLALVLGALALAALASATHDIAADGLYIASLDARQQAMYAGWQGAFFNAGRLAASGGLLVLAGALQRTLAPHDAWSLIFGAIALAMALLAAWHAWALPRAPRAGAAPQALGALLADVLGSFFRKPGIALAIAFIVLFRAGEGQVQTIGPLFLRDAAAAGGLNLSTDRIGIVYGTAGTVAFLLGSVLGGYFTAWLGLKRALPLLIVGMNAPTLVYWWLAAARPDDLALVAFGLGVEMFGYGFGFVGVILYIMQVVAPGPYQTAHYALGTGVMQLGMVLFKAVSGDLQSALGYPRFFLVAALAALPVLALSFFVRVPADAPR